MSLRVLHCIYDDLANPWVGGGGAVRVREIYRRLAGEVEATVATGSFPGARDQTIDGIEYVRLGASAPYAWSRATYSLAAERLLRRASFDAAILDFSVYAPVRVPRHGPVGMTVHHLTGASAVARWGAGPGAIIGEMERRLIARGRRFTVDSRWMARQLDPLVDSEASIDVVPAGVDDALFDIPRQSAGYILYFGRLDVFQKGLDTLIAAVALVRALRPDVQLVVAGRGRDAERIRTMARSLGIDSSVRVLGAVSDDVRRELLAGAAVQVMPSRFEGFGLAAAEAMAAGVPLVASSAGSLPEVVSPPEGGLIVPPADVQSLVTTILRVLESPDLQERMGRTARTCAERFRWSRVVSDHLSFLERLASEGKRNGTERICA